MVCTTGISTNLTETQPRWGWGVMGAEVPRVGPQGRANSGLYGVTPLGSETASSDSCVGGTIEEVLSWS